MSHRFMKYHATGNDFLIFSHPLTHPSEVAKQTCHRRFGFGADGILFPSPSEVAQLKMNYYNADGSIASMCGNGFRAFVRYALDEGLLEGNHFHIETAVGVIESFLHEDGDIELVFTSVIKEVKPPHVKKMTSMKQGLLLDGLDMHVLFVGTLHGIVFVKDPHHISDELAHSLCTHEVFPHHINVNFVHIEDEHTLVIRTYERGVGWTYSCGTGSVASAIVAHELKGCAKTQRIEVKGGSLVVSQKPNGWSLKGSATYVGKGETK